MRSFSTTLAASFAIAGSVMINEGMQIVGALVCIISGVFCVWAASCWLEHDNKTNEWDCES